MTSFEAIDKQLDELRNNKEKWLEVDIDERIALLGDVRWNLASVSEQWVAASIKAKGIEPGTYGEWLYRLKLKAESLLCPSDASSLHNV